MNTRRSLVERFKSKVNQRGSHECWPWIGGTNLQGYGRFYVQGRKRQAAQIAWELFHEKPFPAELCACHSCDNPSCCNPSHIWVGSINENNNDRVTKGRSNNQHRDKESCKHGHSYSGDNVITVTTVSGNTERACRHCRKLHNEEVAQHRKKLRMITRQKGVRA